MVQRLVTVVNNTHSTLYGQFVSSTEITGQDVNERVAGACLGQFDVAHQLRRPSGRVDGVYRRWQQPHVSLETGILALVDDVVEVMFDVVLNLIVEVAGLHASGDRCARPVLLMWWRSCSMSWWTLPS